MLSKTIISALAAIATVQALPAADPNPAGVNYEVLDAFPDGEYLGYTYPNGTMTGHLLDEAGVIKRSIAVHPRAPLESSEVSTKRDGVQRRFVDCWANQFLDRPGTDAAAQCLRNAAAAPGGIDLRSGSTVGLYYSCVRSAVRVYYCVKDPNSWGNANLEDINYGLRQMDARCQPYQASYFRWDNTPEIVGKARADTSICLR
ncbi:hypothetical protein V8F20_003207 [Naviculisporaceae sp. PSN 640]